VAGLTAISLGYPHIEMSFLETEITKRILSLIRHIYVKRFNHLAFANDTFSGQNFELRQTCKQNLVM